MSRGARREAPNKASRFIAAARSPISYLPFAKLTSVPAAILQGEAPGFRSGAELLRGAPVMPDVGIAAFENLEWSFHFTEIVVLRRAWPLQAEFVEVGWKDEVAHGDVVNVEGLLLDGITDFIAPQRASRPFAPEGRHRINQHLA